MLSKMLRASVPLWYLAHPYSGNEMENFEKASRLAGKLLVRGVYVYSPISMTHPIHMQLDPNMDKKQEYELYMPFDQAFAERCNGLLLAPGWEKSKGCCIEREWFKTMERPVHEVDVEGNFKKCLSPEVCYSVEWQICADPERFFACNDSPHPLHGVSRLEGVKLIMKRLWGDKEK